MRLSAVSFIALVFFLLVSLLSFFYDGSISRGTSLHYIRDKFHIEPKTSTDGELALSLCAQVPTIAPSKWVANHNRTLRATLSDATTSGETAVILEQVQPRMCYRLVSALILSNATRLYWLSPTVLGVEHGILLSSSFEYVIDMRTLSYRYQQIGSNSHRAREQRNDQLVD